MVSPNDPIYNSDCLYVNPVQKVFAISDAPGRSTSARKLLTKLDHYLQADSTDSLTSVVNDLNEKTGMEDGKVVGELVPTGIRPKFTDKLEVHGYDLSADVFMTPAQREHLGSFNRR